MSSKHPKGPTMATLTAENNEMRKAISKMQMQAQTALQMAAEERGKYLHVLKLFAAVVAQNMQENKQTIVLHKTLVDQPDTLNLAREEAPEGYAYRLVSTEEMEKVANETPNEPEGSGDSGSLVVEA